MHCHRRGTTGNDGERRGRSWFGLALLALSVQACADARAPHDPLVDVRIDAAAGQAEVVSQAFTPYRLTVGGNSEPDLLRADDRQYVVDLKESDDGRVRIALDSWNRTAGESQRPAAKAITFDPSGNAIVELDNGSSRTLNLVQLTADAKSATEGGYSVLPERFGVTLRELRPRPLAVQPQPTQNRRERILTGAGTAKELKMLRDSFPEEVRVGATQLRFERTAAGRTTTVFFDEAIGSATRVATTEPNGTELTIDSHYERAGKTYQLVREEMHMRGATGNRTITRTFVSPASGRIDE